MKLTKELFEKLDLYSDGYGNVADLSNELMALMKENYDWPSNELTNKYIPDMKKFAEKSIQNLLTLK